MIPPITNGLSNYLLYLSLIQLNNNKIEYEKKNYAEYSTESMTRVAPRLYHTYLYYCTYHVHVLRAIHKYTNFHIVFNHLHTQGAAKSPARVKIHVN